MVTNGSKWFQMVPNGSKGFKCSKWFQMVPNEHHDTHLRPCLFKGCDCGFSIFEQGVKCTSSNMVGCKTFPHIVRFYISLVLSTAPEQIMSGVKYVAGRRNYDEDYY